MGMKKTAGNAAGKHGKNLVVVAQIGHHAERGGGYGGKGIGKVINPAVEGFSSSISVKVMDLGRELGLMSENRDLSKTFFENLRIGSYGWVYTNVRTTGKGKDSGIYAFKPATDEYKKFSGRTMLTP